MTPKRFPLQRGFALVIVLCILVVTTIFVVAFSAIMRSERKASSNFEERERAQAIAEGVLSRILVQQTAPEIEQGKALKPLSDPEYYDTAAKLPRAGSPYLVDPTLPSNEIYQKIYGIVPSDDLSSANHLVQLSRPDTGSGVAAYTPQDWAYLGLPGDTFLPRDVNGNAVAPQWIDYYETLPDGTRDTVPSGQFAYAIWEESGKFDINMIGEDLNINGLAPHDLKIENSIRDSTALLSRLNGANGKRDRNNFGLRAIRPSSDPTNQTGDDQWVFSLKQLLQQGLAQSTDLNDFTTWSRDFDVRPEWDGNRKPATSASFLKSYINNPKLFELFQHREVGPQLVQDTLDEQKLLAALPSSLRESTDKDDWMEVMRLLAVIRRALPPYVKTAAAASTPASPNEWSDSDVLGIALNVIQASSTPSDRNLIAFDQKTYRGSYEDEHNRYGIRISPFITEVAIRIKNTGPAQYQLTEFIKIWNPYDVQMLKPNGRAAIRYNVGELAGKLWPEQRHAIWTISDPKSRKQINAPAPGKFSVVELESRTISAEDLNKQSGATIPAVGGQPKGLSIRHRPFIADFDYFNFTDATANSVLDSHHIQVASASNAPESTMRSYIHSSKLPKEVGDVAWYSWQIDDPRMGAFSQKHVEDTAFFANENSNRNSEDSSYPVASYTWKGYLNRHAIPTEKNDGFYAGRSFTVKGETVDGYNINFGENFPGGISTQADFERAMDTFALPCRPLANLGELGTVFANRPWKTLNLGATIAPGEGLATNSEFGKNPMSFLDYFTTVGTETAERSLNYFFGGSSQTATVPANANKRKRGMRWLFESVSEEPNNVQKPTGNLRPIRGRINLNSANVDTLVKLLQAPYRLPSSISLQARTDLNPRVVATQSGISDLEVKIADSDARMLAQKITEIRPLRAMSDLTRLDDSGSSTLKTLRDKYPASVVNAMIGRLAQYGTVRQQIYTIDLVARSLNREAEKRRLASGSPSVVTAEVRLRARVYFDTFSRQAFIESLETW